MELRVEQTPTVLGNDEVRDVLNAAAARGRVASQEIEDFDGAVDGRPPGTGGDVKSRDVVELDGIRFELNDFLDRAVMRLVIVMATNTTN